MIIETSYKFGDILTFKLMTGDELIARFSAQNEEGITVTKVMTFMMGPQGLGLVPFIFSAPEDAKILLPWKSILTSLKTDETIAKQYQKQTSSVII